MQLVREWGTAGEPFGLGPGLQDGPGRWVAVPGPLGHIVERIEDQQRAGQLPGRDIPEFGIVEQSDQNGHVVPAKHGAEQFDRVAGRNGRDRLSPAGDSSQEICLLAGRLIDSSGDPMGEEFKERINVRAGLVGAAQLCDQIDHLGRVQGQRGNAQCASLGFVVLVRGKHIPTVRAGLLCV